MAEGKVEDSVKTVAEVVSGVLEKAPIYEDAAQPALREIGQGLGGMLKMVVLPFKMMGYKADKLLEDFQERLNKKGETIPQENLQAPNPIIAGPIIQSLGYTLHEEPLREMFTNLLVTGMNSSRESDAHPAFVEIIKQLSVDEALILKAISQKVVYKARFEDGKVVEFSAHDQAVRLPIANFDRRLTEGKGTVPLRRNVCLLARESGCSNFGDEEKYIDNLIRLGLINVRYGYWLTDESLYVDIQKSLESLKLEVTLPDGESLEMDKGVVEVTGFGKKFIAACVVDVSGLQQP